MVIGYNLKTLLKLYLIVLFLFAVYCFRGSSVQAACAVGQYGSVNLTANVPSAGSYKIWFRISPASTNKTFNVEIDGGSCYSVTGNGTSWAWVAMSSTVNFSTAGGHTLKLVGTQPSVGIDRVILLGSSDACTPDNVLSATTKPGDNCLTTVAPPPNTDGSANSDTAGQATVVTTSSGQAVQVAGSAPINSGNVVLDSSLVTDEAKIQTVEKVEYFADGKLVQTLTAPPFFLDTTKLKNGTYEITEKVYFKDGTAQVKSSIITIENDPVVSSGSSSKRGLQIGFGLLGVLMLAGVGLAKFYPPSRIWFSKVLNLVRIGNRPKF